MKTMKMAVAVALSGLLCLSVAAPAGAKRGAKGGKSQTVTRMSVSLSANEVTVGDTVTAEVRLAYGKGRNPQPLAGATLEVSVDETPMPGVVTDATGTAVFDVTAEVEGEHTVRVFFAGDATYKKSLRAKGFTALPVATVEQPAQ